MHSKRFFTLAFVLTLPFFLFAQTTTSIAEQPPDLLEQLSAFELNSDQVLMDYLLQVVSTTKESQTKAVTDNITIITTPEYPGPNETIKATVRGYLIDLNRSNISWSINGKIIDKGVGRETFSFQNGDSGKTTTLAMVINTSDGMYIKKERSFKPIGMTISWEADTYTPPFYKGKPLLSPEALVRVVVFPDTGAHNNFVYDWSKNTTVITNASGYGKNSFSLKGPIPFNETGVRVHVSSLDKTQQSTKKLNLVLSKPFILFYEDLPLLGIWYNHPIGRNITITKKELSIIAEPFFFSNENSEETTLAYNWSLNRVAVRNYGRTVTLRNAQDGRNVSSLALAMRGVTQTFQSASRSLTINFATDESSRPTF